MCDDCWLWAWGAAGALMFAGGALGLKLFADPSQDSASDKRRLRLALDGWREAWGTLAKAKAWCAGKSP